jgi:hypothetical protein
MPERAADHDAAMSIADVVVRTGLSADTWSVTRFPGHRPWGGNRLGEESCMPAAEPLEFRRRAVEPARQRWLDVALVDSWHGRATA